MKKLTENLKLKLQNLPDAPGVYLFKDDTGRIIYIGKARVLKSRVRSYFQNARTPSPRTDRLVARVADLDLMVTASEVEALILEANLVREHKPRYNVMLKDDKHFPYIKITTNEPFPRVLIVRRLEKDGATYFGPYTSSRHMRQTVALLTKLFQVRSCNYTIPHPQGKLYQVCLDYHIKRCQGPCAGLQSQEDYRSKVDNVIKVLSGRPREVIDDLTGRMIRASEQMQFEEAALCRDQIEAVRAVMLKQNVDVGEMVDRDIISVAREGSHAVAVVMQIRQGVLIGRQDFQLTADSEEPDSVVVETFLAQYYNHQPNLPDEVFLPLETEDAALFEHWLSKLRGRRVHLYTPKIGRKVRLVDLAASNARLLLDELLIQKRKQSERISKMVTALKDDLGLAHSPVHIACFDISNTGETDAVGSCVYFENARPKKSEYRHFRIKGVRGQDDFKMMREIVGRYFHRLHEHEKPPPDLVVVDGGKGQLGAVLAELRYLGHDDQPVIGLAKRLEEVYVPNQSDPLTISRSSPGLILLRQLRDEAHRFAITYNRKVRSKRTIASRLDAIPGVGPAKRDALLKHFGSVKRIREATTEQLTEVKGVNRKLAEAIKTYLK
jgi:excinuclease ABC subunit C